MICAIAAAVALVLAAVELRRGYRARRRAHLEARFRRKHQAYRLR